MTTIATLETDAVATRPRTDAANSSSGRTIFTNARLVLPTEVVGGTVIVEEDRILAIDGGPTAVPGAIDLDGDHLMPGLVELHTDNAERYFEPRPGVRWPNGIAAALAHDAQMAAAGVTTVFDSL